MLDGLTTYDYTVLQECNDAFKREVEAMDANIDEFQGKVAEIVEQTWSGDSAAGYNAKADELNKVLDEKRIILMEIDKALADGAQRMQEADRRGQSRVDSV